MQAVAVFPGRREVRVVDHPEPSLPGAGEVKLQILEVGVCGTDRELCAFHFGEPPEGDEYFVLGHESLAEVVECGPEVSGIAPGDLAVALVRHPCGDAACAPCAAGHQDFCSTGRYAERGIVRLHGFMTAHVVERQGRLRVLPPELRETGVLVEPLTIAEKAFRQMRAIGTRLPWAKEKGAAVVLGAGPVGVLGAMLLRSAGFDTWVYSRAGNARIIEETGARYVSSEAVTPERLACMAGNIDLVYEAMGAPQLAFDVLQRLGANGLFVFTGVPQAGERIDINAQALLVNMVLKNQVVAGTVNAGTDDFDAAIRDLGAFLRRWPAAVRGLIAGRYPLEGFRDAVFGSGAKNVIVVDGG